MFTKKLTSLAVGASLLLGMGTAAQAGFLTLSNTITAGDNTYEDQSREAYFDVNGDGLFGVGDVLAGFVRLDNKSQPNGINLENHMYAIFSQEITSITNTGVTEFGAVTAGNGLSLSELGVAAAGANDMFALYTSNVTPTGFSVDMVINSPGDQTGNGTTTLADYFSLIQSEGTVEMIMGIVAPTCTGGTTDCFQGTSVFAGGPNGIFIGLPTSVTVSNFVAGLEVTQDPNGWTINDTTVAGAFSPPAPITTIAEFALSNGAARGSSGSVNESEWIDGSELSGVAQCTGEQGVSTCGFIDDADFSFNATRVPEPTTIALLGMGLLGIGAARRRRKS